MKLALTFLTALMVVGSMACAEEGDTSTDESTGALEQGATARCGPGSGRRTRTTDVKTLASRIDEGKIKLAANPRDPAAVPVGARNPKYLASLELKEDGKFVAKLSSGTKLKGTFTISAPRCAANFEMLTLDPVGEDDADGLFFKVVRGHDADAPNRYSFVPAQMEGGWTTFNMTLDAPEEAQTPPEASCNCDDLPKPRCFGAYVCEEGACVWRSPVGGPRCGP